MGEVGRSQVRVDAYDKATGRTKYYEDQMPQDALYVRIKHAEIAHGFVKSVDTSAAEAVDGVVKVLTCFDVPGITFPTAGHPWSMDPGHQDVADRHLLNRHVRYWGDDVAVVIAENEVAAMQGVRALKVEYEELPFVLDPQKAMEEGAPQLHEKFPHNILKHTGMKKGDYQTAIQEPGLIKVEGWYDTPTVQHCHIENHGCFAYEENGRIVVISSTQIPHIIRRIVGQALGRPWADIRVVKPYIGGGFGNKQDALYEPLCAWCTTQVGGRTVRIDCSREETFVSNRVRHAIRFHIVSWLRKDGTFAARKVECFSNQGAYASHGHSIVAKALGSFNQHYPCPNFEGDAYTVFTNRPAAGAMRGYGMPQASFADESHAEECAKAVGMTPLAYRWQTLLDETKGVAETATREYLRIGAVFSTNQYILPAAYRRFLHRKLPVALWVQTLRGAGYDGAQTVARRELEMALMDGDSFFHPQLDITPLCSEETMVACSPDSPYGDVVSPRDLDPASEIVVSWRKSVQDWRDHWFGLTTAPLLYADSMQVVNTFLGSEMMWAIVPAAAARALEKEGRAKICRLTDPPPERVSYLITRRGETLSSAAQLLLEDVRTEIRHIPGIQLFI